jgi:hypothetical protein
MIRMLSAFGFFAGIALLLLAFFNPQTVGSLAASEDSSGCRTVQVPLDEGYGISRVESREVCGSAR